MASFVLKIKYEETLRRLTVPQGNAAYPPSPAMSFRELEESIRKMFKLPSSSEIILRYTDTDNDVITFSGDEDLHDACVVQGLNPLRLHVTLVAAGTPPTPAGWTPPGPSEFLNAALAKARGQGLFVPPGGGGFGSWGRRRFWSFPEEPLVPSSSSEASSSTDEGSTSKGNAVNSTAFAAAAAGPPPPAHPVAVAAATYAEGANGVRHFGIQCDACNMFPILGPRFKSKKKIDFDLCQACFQQKRIECDDDDEYTRIDRPIFPPQHFPSSSNRSEAPCPPMVGPSRCPALMDPSGFPAMGRPSGYPETSPSGCPPMGPSGFPATGPSGYPETSPSGFPAMDRPSGFPATGPSGCPAMGPSGFPAMDRPSGFPATGPSGCPAMGPSGFPAMDRPSGYPAMSPSGCPATGPSGCPAMGPSGFPAMGPSGFPAMGRSSGYPATSPSGCPPLGPSRFPAMGPSGCPAMSPSGFPAVGPSGCAGMNPSFFFVRGGESEHDGGGCDSSSSFAGKPVCCRSGELACECGGGSKLDARFVQDVTIFDGTELAPGASFTKIWRLRNSGSLPWPKECRLVYVGGDEELGGSVDDETSLLLELPEQGLAPPEEVNVSVDLVAPMQPGRYVSYWRLVAPSPPPSEGQRFGHRLWVLIHVTPKDEESPQVAESLVEAQEILHAQDSKQQSVVEEETTSQELFSSVRAETTVGVDPVDKAQQQQQQQQQIEGEKKIVDPEVFKEETAAAAPTTGTVVERQAAAAAVGNDADDHHRLAKGKEEAAGVVEASELGSFSIIEIPQETEMLATLEGMGFKDKNWNLELLKMNKNDMQTTLDALVTAAEWDPKLEELEEMGFSDKQLNRKLMLKNKGSL
ncbi:unnamed protein product, partial [Sphagnum tenellum]